VRVIAPFVLAHPLALESLQRFAPNAEQVEIGEDPMAYTSLLGDLWARQEDFVVIEQDIEIHQNVLLEFLQCSQPWCVFPYNGPGYGQAGDSKLTKSLGCVRFSRELVTSCPDLFDTLQQVSWRRLDVELADVLAKHGFISHLHYPMVRQHHVYHGRCACDSVHDVYPVDDEGRYNPSE